VLGAAQERLRAHQGSSVQDRRDEHEQDGQARPRQDQHGRHRHLHVAQVRRDVAEHAQHDGAARRAQRVRSHRHLGRRLLHSARRGQERDARGHQAARGRSRQGDSREARGRRAGQVRRSQVYGRGGHHVVQD